MRDYLPNEKNNSLPAVGCWLLLLCFLVLGYQPARAQVVDPFPEIRIQMPEKQYRALQKTRGQKMNFKNAVLSVNGQPADLDDLHLRGKSTLSFRRKSFSVDLKEAVAIPIQDRTVELSRFDLLSLSMDKNFWHNRWSFLVLAELGIFPPMNTYCTLLINAEPQGIYLLTEKPQHAMESLNSPYMIRRGLNSVIEKEYVKTNSKEAVKSFRKQYHSLYGNGNLGSASLYNHLIKALNTESYFLWLGFNYFVMNGDYSDELFLYINPESGLFEVMAWDYDDLFRDVPHEGKIIRNRAYRDRYLFSLEDQLDLVIAADDFLYDKYRASFLDLLNVADSTLLTRTSHKVLEELRALDSDPETGKSSLYLDNQPFVFKDAASDMERSMQFLYHRRALLLDALKKNVKGDQGN